MRQSSVLATREQHRQHHKIGCGKAQLLSLPTGSLRGANDAAEMLSSGHTMKMFEADSRQAGNLLFGESLLTRFDGYHFAFAIPLAGQAD